MGFGVNVVSFLWDECPGAQVLGRVAVACLVLKEVVKLSFQSRCVYRVHFCLFFEMV